MPRLFSRARRGKMMERITHEQIEQMFPRDVFERGRTYYKEERVHGLSFHKHERAWFAEVHGSEPYYVEVGMKKLAESKVRLYCECPAYHTYRTCKHLVAVLLAVADREQNEALSPEWTERFLRDVVQHVHVPTTTPIFEKMPMQVEYILRLDQRDKVWLQCKTGVSHRYVIHRMREFLDDILAEEAYYFTKKFTYDPEKHFFSQEDMEVFTLIHDIITTGDMFTDRYYDAANAYDRREVLIPPVLFKNLLRKIKTRHVTVETESEAYSSIHIVDKELPTELAVQETDETAYTLSITKREDERYLQAYKVIFAHGTFYFPENAQLQFYEQISALPTETNVPITKEQAMPFFSEVVPTLKQITTVEVDETLTASFIDKPLEAKLYLQWKNTVITGKLLYRYGSVELNPFYRDEDLHEVVIRDVQKEKQIMNIIEQANFHFNGEELYIDVSEDAILYEFLHTIVPELEKYVTIYAEKEIQQMIVTEQPKPTVSVDVQTDTNLLEIGFEISGVDEAEVTELLQAIVLKKQYYRLRTGGLLSLEGEEYEATRQFLIDLALDERDLVQDSVIVPAYRSAQLDEYEDLSLQYSATFRQLIKRMKEPEKQRYAIPEQLHATLRDYQKVGFQWFKSLSAYGLGGILADDMGLGKTIQTITFLLSERSEKPHLVVAPSSVVYNWHNEFNKFAPSFRVAVIAGTKEERVERMKESEDADVWITSYGTLRQDEAVYADYTFHTFILDEAQYVKNYATKTSRVVRQIQAQRRFALSGTPIENSLHELWAIFQVILPGFLPSEKQFKHFDVARIAQITRPFILRRLKRDVLQELPEKIESVHISELSREQKELYVGYLHQLKTEAEATFKANAFQKNRMKILAGLTRLRQICCHPSLFIENYQGTSQKLEELIESVQTMLKQGRRILIFSQFTSMHEIIMQRLEALHIPSFYLHGQTNAKERLAMAEAFNNGEKDVFLISLKAGGTGLNLTGADTVILYDLWWNPAVEDQAADRAHRYGQKNVVHVIRYITEGTIEEKIYELQRKKRQLIDKVIQPGATMIDRLSEEEIRELLNL